MRNIWVIVIVAAAIFIGIWIGVYVTGRAFLKQGYKVRQQSFTSSGSWVTWTDLNKVIAVNNTQTIDIKKLQDSLLALKKWVNLPETIRADLPLQYYLNTSDKKVHIRLTTP